MYYISLCITKFIFMEFILYDCVQNVRILPLIMLQYEVMVKNIMYISQLINVHCTNEPDNMDICL